MKVVEVNISDIDLKDFGFAADKEDKRTFYYVIDGEEKVALFDIRDAIDTLKQMSIYYSEKFFSEYSLDKVEGAIEKMIDVLDSIFEFIQELLRTKWERAKIYSRNRGEGMVFKVLADQVKTLGTYRVTYYSKWIDIEPIEV
jgi:hypothetical protein